MSEEPVIEFLSTTKICPGFVSRRYSNVTSCPCVESSIFSSAALIPNSL